MLLDVVEEPVGNCNKDCLVLVRFARVPVIDIAAPLSK